MITQTQLKLLIDDLDSVVCQWAYCDGAQDYIQDVKIALMMAQDDLMNGSYDPDPREYEKDFD